MVSSAIHCGIRCADIVWLAATRTVPDNCCPSLPVSERAVQLIKQPFKTQGQLLPGFGQDHFARGAIKQPNAGLVFQLFHAVADRRLAQADHLPARLKLRA